MAAKRPKTWHLVAAVVLMLAAIFAYVASIDEADPDALPGAAEQIDGH